MQCSMICTMNRWCNKPLCSFFTIVEVSWWLRKWHLLYIAIVGTYKVCHPRSGWKSRALRQADIPSRWQVVWIWSFNKVHHNPWLSPNLGLWQLGLDWKKGYAPFTVGSTSFGLSKNRKKTHHKLQNVNWYLYIRVTTIYINHFRTAKVMKHFTKKVDSYIIS